MEVRILEINESLYTDKAKSVSVPGLTGDMQLLPGHESIVTVLKSGSIVVVDMQGKKHTFEIEHGYLEATPEQITIIL